MTEGTQAHRARQRAAQESHPGYAAEVTLATRVAGDGLTLEVSGRADGLFERAGQWVVEEIKLSDTPPPPVAPWPAHLAQAACYGHMLCADRGLDGAVLRVLYVDAQGAQTACFENAQTATELAGTFHALARAYLAYAQALLAWRQARDAGLAALAFPYPDYRPGQRAFAANVYVAIRDGRRLLAQAPTGIGKTVAALFPALKALGAGLTGQVYYLTARTTGRAVALAALDRLCRDGLPLRVLEIVAKEKCCPRPGGVQCDPAACSRAKGFFLRLDAGLAELAARPRWAAPVIRDAADAHALCPFEFSLCLCETADVVVCDYNYALDPAVRLQRVFQQRHDVTLLVDEAHHLADRARDMLSAGLDTAVLGHARRAWHAAHKGKEAVHRAASGLMQALRDAAGPGDREEALARPPDIHVHAERFAQAAGEALDSGLAAGPEGRSLLDALLMARQYLARLQDFDGRYVALLARRGREVALTLRCLDPAPYLRDVTRRLRGVALFSATLAPLPGYAALLGLDADADGLLALPSPFSPERLRVLCRPISTRWQHRAETAGAVAQAVAAMVRATAGNYLCLFPSYAYLADIHALLGPLLPGVTLQAQQPDMDEAGRAAFLAAFQPMPNGTLLGLAVLGGPFAEGVDLPGDRLCGVAAVGIGLPQVCAEREALRAYYGQNAADGFAMAYRIPGLTRVTQAVGRVIRSPQDRGVALLIDDRFSQAAVQALLPSGWLPLQTADSAAQVQERFAQFWGEEAAGS
jgi:DNA excision repair protein ERCC-2